MKMAANFFKTLVGHDAHTHRRHVCSGYQTRVDVRHTSCHLRGGENLDAEKKSKCGVCLIHLKMDFRQESTTNVTYSWM